MKEIFTAIAFAVLLTAVPALAADTSTNNNQLLQQVRVLASKARPATRTDRPRSRTLWIRQAHRPELRILNHLRMQKASKEPRATRAARLRSLTPRESDFFGLSRKLAPGPSASLQRRSAEGYSLSEN